MKDFKTGSDAPALAKRSDGPCENPLWLRLWRGCCAVARAPQDARASCTDSRGLFERSERSERSEFHRAPRKRRDAGLPRSAAQGSQTLGRLLLPTFLGETRKVGAPPGAHPGQRGIQPEEPLTPTPVQAGGQASRSSRGQAPLSRGARGDGGVACGRRPSRPRPLLQSVPRHRHDGANPAFVGAGLPAMAALRVGGARSRPRPLLRRVTQRTGKTASDWLPVRVEQAHEAIKI